MKVALPSGCSISDGLKHFQLCWSSEPFLRRLARSDMGLSEEFMHRVEQSMQQFPDIRASG